MPITQAAGGDQMDFIETYNATTASTAGAVVANDANFQRVRVAKPIAVTTMAYLVGTASGNVDLGIYDSSDGGTTLTRLASTGSTAASGSTAIQAIALTASLVLVPGKDYWLAFAADNATITAVRVGPTAAYIARKQRSFLKASSFPLPASVASLSGGIRFFWLEAS